MNRREFFRKLVPYKSGGRIEADGYSSPELNSVSNSSISRRYLVAIGAAAIAHSISELYAACRPNRPRALIGSPSSLTKQMNKAKSDGLSMLRDKDIERFMDNDLLVQLPRDRAAYYIDEEDVPMGYAAVRPWTRLFVERLAAQYYANFGTRLRISGAGRSIERQNGIRKTNPNATLPEKSPHVRGAAVDIRYDKMYDKAIRWMRRTLVSLERAGVLEATEECGQPVFHVMIFRREYPAYVQRIEKMTYSQFKRYYKNITGVELA